MKVCPLLKAPACVPGLDRGHFGVGQFQPEECHHHPSWVPRRSRARHHRQVSPGCAKRQMGASVEFLRCREAPLASRFELEKPFPRHRCYPAFLIDIVRFGSTPSQVQARSFSRALAVGWRLFEFLFFGIVRPAGEDPVSGASRLHLASWAPHYLVSHYRTGPGMDDRQLFAQSGGRPIRLGFGRITRI
jgi:hypothetical protein